MRARTCWLILALLLASLPLAACGGDDDDDDNATPDDDATDDDTADDDFDDDGDDDDSVDDDTFDDDTGDDDTGDDDTVDDDTGDDDTSDDDTADDDTDTYVAPWPQTNVEVQDYDETVSAGDRRLKAMDYDLWHEGNHQPFYGSTVGAKFTDDTRTTVDHYFDSGDSCIWTGTYLAGQAFRYYVTGDAQAKANAIRMVEALDGHLHITGRAGFIARYRGPQDTRIMPPDCATQENCHVVNDGMYAGDFWQGNTSRDQYTGWFFGFSIAYDLVDDEDMRDMIRADVTEVMDELIANHWWIKDVDGLPTTAGPNVLSVQQLTWSLIAYHITGEERFKAEVQRLVKDSARLFIVISDISFMNLYAQYYGNNLAHENFYNLLRLAKVYLSKADYEFLSDSFDNQIHTFTRLSHNAFFNTIFMSQGQYVPEAGDPYQAQLEQDLGEFRDAPNFKYYIDPETTELDPVSVFLDNLMEQYPFLKEIMGDVDPQAAEAFPVQLQCETDFLWQRSPFSIGPCGSDDPSSVQPGVDYIVAYWMASYHKFITKDM